MKGYNKILIIGIFFSLAMAVAGQCLAAACLLYTSPSPRD